MKVNVDSRYNQKLAARVLRKAIDGGHYTGYMCFALRGMVTAGVLSAYSAKITTAIVYREIRPNASLLVRLRDSGKDSSPAAMLRYFQEFIKRLEEGVVVWPN